MKKLLSLILSLMLLGCTACNNQGSTGGNESADISSESTENSSEETKQVIKIIPEKSSYDFIMDGNEQPIEISAKVLVNSETVQSPELTYVVKDPEVCEINGNMITPKGAGKTDVDVIYGEGKATVTVSVSEKTTATSVNTFDEKFINTYGRTYVNDSKLCLDHVGTGLGVAIDGSRLDVEIEATGTNYLCVYIDGEEEYSSRIKITAGKKLYSVAEDLTKGFHTIRMVKSSEVYDGQIKIVDIDSEGFYTAPEKSSLYIEFIGDSITAGYGALGSIGSARTVDNSDGCSSYAYQTARMLGSDYSMVAIQGICVKAYYWLKESMSEVYKKVSPLNPVEYSFEKQPDVVVLNLGTNDAGYIVTKDYDYVDQFPIDYLDFLTFIRSKYPNAYIVCAYGFMGVNNTVQSGIDKAIENMGDEKVLKAGGYYIADNSGANGHPSKEAQYKWAETLSDFIVSITKK